MTESHGVGASVQIAKNLHAVQASQALSRLSGLCSDENSTPYNQDASEALRALLTPKLASMLKDQVPRDLLSRLNTNLESPEVNPVTFFFPIFLVEEILKQVSMMPLCDRLIIHLLLRQLVCSNFKGCSNSVA